MDNSIEKPYRVKVSAPWWEGDQRVEEFMPQIKQALDASLLSGEDKTTIYNRCYSAVYHAIDKYSCKISVTETTELFPKGNRSSRRKAAKRGKR